MCGGCAGITSVTFTYPLDIVRTRLSIQSASFAALGQDPAKKLPGMMATMMNMYKSEGGFGALYRGIIPTIAGVAPYVSPCLVKVLETRLLTTCRWGSISWSMSRYDNILLQKATRIPYGTADWALGRSLAPSRKPAHIPCKEQEAQTLVLISTLLMLPAAMCYEEGSKSTRCLEWATNTNRYGMLSRRLSPKKASVACTRA